MMSMRNITSQELIRQKNDTANEGLIYFQSVADGALYAGGERRQRQPAGRRRCGDGD
ncbi:protein of unknown function [Serratia sp. Tan611]|nr:protein of unknown function [Serratia sp. Tan611]